jgi:hypothetical protein
VPAASPSASLRSIASTLALGTALWACSPQRPDPTRWEASWNAVHARVPVATALAGPDGPDACEELLVAARQAREELLPAPDPVMDAAVAQWIDAAGAFGFDCPKESAKIRAGLDQLTVLSAEVTASLRMVRGAPNASRGS